jgi:hypothetical protein
MKQNALNAIPAVKFAMATLTIVLIVISRILVLEIIERIKMGHVLVKLVISRSICGNAENAIILAWSAIKKMRALYVKLSFLIIIIEFLSIINANALTDFMTVVNTLHAILVCLPAKIAYSILIFARKI